MVVWIYALLLLYAAPMSDSQQSLLFELPQSGDEPQESEAAVAAVAAEAAGEGGGGGGGQALFGRAKARGGRNCLACLLPSVVVWPRRLCLSRARRKPSKVRCVSIPRRRHAVFVVSLFGFIFLSALGRICLLNRPPRVSSPRSTSDVFAFVFCWRIFLRPCLSVECLLLLQFFGFTSLFRIFYPLSTLSLPHLCLL